MIVEDFYTGERQECSPGFVTNDFEVDASFGKYLYDTGGNNLGYGYDPPLSQEIYPGYYGYNTCGPVGLGSGNYSSYGNPNPVFSIMGGQKNQQQQTYPSYNTYRINPVGWSGEFMPSFDMDKRIEDLKRKYWEKEQEASLNNNYYNMYTNYYGTPFYSYNYGYTSVMGEINREIDKIKDEARENRRIFETKLSKLAFKFAGVDISDEDIEEMHTGKTVQVEEKRAYQMYQDTMFDNLVPFDNSAMYREMHQRISDEYHSIIPEDSDMQTAFENHALLHYKYEMEEEEHRRRNYGVLYDSNSYKSLIKLKVAERKNSKYNNSSSTTAYQAINNFPTLKESVHLEDDGTLNITCNFGSRAGEVYSVHNSQEAEYEKDRERFQGFLDAIPNSIYLNNNIGGVASG